MLAFRNVYISVIFRCITCPLYSGLLSVSYSFIGFSSVYIYTHPSYFHIFPKILCTAVWYTVSTFQQRKCMMTSANGNIFRVTGPLWKETTGHRWITIKKASDAELWCFLWCAPEQIAEQTVHMLVNWGDIALIMTSLYWSSIIIFWEKDYVQQRKRVHTANDMPLFPPLSNLTLIKAKAGMSYPIVLNYTQPSLC